jgi:flagellar protein FliJ
MPRFRFQLQPVLDQRHRVEEQIMLEVATLERERLSVESRLKDLQSRIIASKHDLRSRLQFSTSPEDRRVAILDVRLQANASLHLAAQAQRVAIELAGAYQRVEAARRRLLQATTARKAVETLKDRRHSEWKHEQSRREFVQLDEILTSRTRSQDDQS